MSGFASTPGRYWWHKEIADFLCEWKDGRGCYVAGIASAVGQMTVDTGRRIDEMIAWGEVEETEGPDGHPGRWVKLTAAAG